MSGDMPGDQERAIWPNTTECDRISQKEENSFSLGERGVFAIHVVPGISAESSGPTYSVSRLCESLGARGNDIRLATLQWTRHRQEAGYVVSFPISWGPRRLGRSRPMLQWLRREASRGRAALLHNHGMWQMNALYPSRVAAEYGLKLVVSPRGALSGWAMKHGSWTKRLFWPLWQYPALRRADCFHATAEVEYRDIRRWGFSQPVAVIPNGIDLPELASREVMNKRTLLFLGRLHPVKGVDVLLCAWRRVQERYPEWQLRIAGSDSGYYGLTGYAETLKRMTSERGLTRVEFAGELLGSTKAVAMRSAELFVLPSHSENFGMTVAEALASGTPAIVSLGAPWGGLVANDAGWWIDSGVEPLVKCLEKALACEPKILSDMGMRGRAWMEREFSWRSVAERMDATYRWLFTPGASPPSCVHVD